MGRRILLHAATTLGLGISLVGSLSGGHAEDMGSCRAITEPGEYRLSGDIGGEGNCLEIRANDVTLDGGGHVVAGTDSGTGILVAGNDVLVRNVEVQGFEHGIRIAAPGYAGIELADVDVRANGVGIRAQMGRDLSIRESTISENDGPGLFYHVWDGVQIDGTSIAKNVGPAIRSEEGWNLHLSRCRIQRNGRGIDFVPGDEIRESVISENDGVGLRMDPFPQPPFVAPAIVSGNRIRQNDGTGIELTLGTAEIRRNSIAGHADSGIRVSQTYDDGPEWIPRASLALNAFGGNSGTALLNETDVRIVASCNWWGHESGPKHPDNPNGAPEGEEIVGDVAFVPWLTSPVGGTCTGGLEDRFGSPVPSLD